MKSARFSQQQHGILISLALFCPALLAAEKLNFDYSRDDAISLPPRLMAVKADVCHSRADPMEIRFRFNQMENSGDDFRVTLMINGDTWAKNYGVFSSADNGARSDAGFQVPWSVHVKGQAKGVALFPRLVRGSTQDTYGERFCFSDKFKVGNTTGSDIYEPFFKANFDGYIPVFESESTFYSRYCQDSQRYDVQLRSVKEVEVYTPETHPALDYIWGGRPTNTPMPERIRNKYNSDKKYLTKNIFYTDFQYPDSNLRSYNETKDFDSGPMDIIETRKNFNYTFPTGKGVSTRLEQSEFTLKLGNRNISSLTLTITNHGVSDSWTWTTAKDDGKKNNLYLQHSANLGVKPTINNDNDLYFDNNFYVNPNNNMYRGALAAASALSQTYHDYISNTVALSLPPDSAGTINLLNTESLFFMAGSDQDGIKLSIYGQPLKFFPLSLDNRATVSAMQLRNNCH